VVATIILAFVSDSWQQTALAGATAAVSGGLIGFPLKQRADARRQHQAAIKVLEKNGCGVAR